MQLKNRPNFIFCDTFYFILEFHFIYIQIYTMMELKGGRARATACPKARAGQGKYTKPVTYGLRAIILHYYL